VTRAGFHKPGDTVCIQRGPITTTQLVMYAGASGDFNRIHYDHPFAVEKGLGGVIAHGMLTMAFAASCAVEAFGQASRISHIDARSGGRRGAGHGDRGREQRSRGFDRGSAHGGGRWARRASRHGRGHGASNSLECDVMNAILLTDTGVSVDSRTLRNAFGCFPSGVTAICAMIDAEPVGMAASSFTSVSLDPALVLACIRNNSDTWKKLKHAPRIGVSVLGEDHGRACSQLAARSGDRFEGLDWFTTEGGAVLLEGAAASLDCSVAEEIAAGDHKLVLLRIEALAFQPAVSPLVFHGSRFRKLAIQTATSE
jgi:flavin reductase (DIM6/NTAB) family NADH-FMN oxidoreductase RutF